MRQRQKKDKNREKKRKRESERERERERSRAVAPEPIMAYEFLVIAQHFLKLLDETYAARACADASQTMRVQCMRVRRQRGMNHR